MSIVGSSSQRGVDGSKLASRIVDDSLRTMDVETRHVKYVFADVVEFTVNRTVEAQVEIVAALGEAFRTAAEGLETIFLPTGDGICAAIIQSDAAPDSHLLVALKVLASMHQWSEDAAENRKCTIRFALNESVDSLIRDINGNKNLAGPGINHAQRLLSLADGNQILVGHAVFETLRLRDQYVTAFRRHKAEVKHGEVITAYQFIQSDSTPLNTGIPLSVRQSDPIDLKTAEKFAEDHVGSTSSQVAILVEGMEAWRDEIRLTIEKMSRTMEEIEIEKIKTGEIHSRLSPTLKDALANTQAGWENYFQTEVDFLNELRATFHGTWFRVISADFRLEMIRQRAILLRRYLREWVGAEDEIP